MFKFEKVIPVKTETSTVNFLNSPNSIEGCISWVSATMRFKKKKITFQI